MDFKANGNYYIYLVILLSSIIIITSIIIIIVNWLKNKLSPKVVVQSTISNKYMKKNNVYRQGDFAPGIHLREIITYYVTFNIESGEDIEFRVSKSKYLKLKKGNKGKLTYQGGRFIRFDRYN